MTEIDNRQVALTAKCMHQSMKTGLIDFTLKKFSSFRVSNEGGKINKCLNSLTIDTCVI